MSKPFNLQWKDDQKCVPEGGARIARIAHVEKHNTVDVVNIDGPSDELRGRSGRKNNSNLVRLRIQPCLEPASSTHVWPHAHDIDEPLDERVHPGAVGRHRARLGTNKEHRTPSPGHRETRPNTCSL